MLPVLSTFAVLFTIAGVTAAANAADPDVHFPTYITALVGALVGLAGVLDRILRILLTYKKLYEELSYTVRNKGPDSIFDTLAEKPTDSALVKRLKQQTHGAIKNPPPKIVKVGNALRAIGSFLPFVGRGRMFR